MANLSPVICKLMDALDRADVLHCHWKSNEHLEAGLNGKTDIDVLVAKKDADTFREVLKKDGWLFDAAPPFTEMEHWMGFDELSGKLFHVHLHTAGLPVGPTKRKIFTLPLEVSDWILENRIRYKGVWIASPETELFMLVLRFALKSGPRNLAGAFVRRRDVVPKNLRTELNWLLEQIDGENSNCSALPSKFTVFMQEMLSIMQDESSTAVYAHILPMMNIRCMVLPYITPSRIFAKRKKGGKTLQHPAPVFAFVGVDGSGKTTMVTELKKWLGWKFNAQVFYLGTPKKKGFGGLLHKVTGKIPGGIIFFKFYAALYRYFTALSAHRNARKGRIVVTDRYPTPLLWGISDGPRMKGLMSGLDRALYRRIPPPSYLIVLRVPEEVLRERDTTMKPESRTKKFLGMEKLCTVQDGTVPVVVVDANQDFDKVLLDCKKFIFEAMRAVSF